MTDRPRLHPERPSDDLHAALGYAPLNQTWAKLEIVFGLTAVYGGVLLGARDADVALTTAGGLLFVLGGYLAMAGHRSHLYQSNNELTAYLARRVGPAGSPPRPAP